MPSARLFLACGLVTLALVGSVAAPSLAWVALAADALLLAAFALDRARAAAGAARGRADLAAAAGAGSGAHGRGRGALCGRAPGRAAAARGAPPGARGRAASHALHGARARPPPLALCPHLPPPRRAPVPPLAVRVLGPWGLAWSQRTLVAPQSVRVYPQVRWQGEVGRLLALAHRRELGRTPVRLSASDRSRTRCASTGRATRRCASTGRRAPATTASSRARTPGSAARAS